MSKQSARHVSTNIPSARTTTTKSALSSSSRPTVTTSSRAANIEFIDYNASDAYRKETILKVQEGRRAWTAKFNPWLVDEYQQMYDKIAKNRGVSRETCVISLKRTEWQQPPNAFPPLYQRLTGQRRRRLLGAFPQTENDKIGWRLLPQQAIDAYGGLKATHFNQLPKQYKFSSWPIESFY